MSPIIHPHNVVLMILTHIWMILIFPYTLLEFNFTLERQIPLILVLVNLGKVDRIYLLPIQSLDTFVGLLLCELMCCAGCSLSRNLQGLSAMPIFANRTLHFITT